jgi:hypothetical protein
MNYNLCTMKTLKFLVIITAFSYFAAPLFAQGDFEERLEKFKTQRIAFITDQLNLTPKEAETFWPVYNEFDTKRQTINRERMKLARQYLKTNNTLSEKEASEMADKFISYQKQEALLAEEYNIKFKSILPATKVLKLYQSEIQFKRKLLKQLRQGAFKGPGNKQEGE